MRLHLVMAGLAILEGMMPLQTVLKHSHLNRCLSSNVVMACMHACMRAQGLPNQASAAPGPSSSLPGSANALQLFDATVCFLDSGSYGMQGAHFVNFEPIAWLCWVHRCGGCTGAWVLPSRHGEREEERKGTGEGEGEGAGEAVGD